MSQSSERSAVAIVGVGAVLPDAPDVPTFWQNLTTGRYSISETPPERWALDKYYDPDAKVPDKTYSKIGGWVRNFTWDPFSWKMPIPPKVGDRMDRTQKWAVAAAREALLDFGYPDREFDRDRTAIIVGNAMGGDYHYMTSLRIYAPEYVDQLESSPTFAALDEAQRRQIVMDLLKGIDGLIPSITEDTMPGELANIIAGRIAAVFDLHGPNYVTDAACASAMAAMSAAVEGLAERHFDIAVSGGVDANMSASTFVKFCKIGALSATGTRPYDRDADGFVMGEGAAIFVLKRLEDAERDGDRVYAVIRGIGGASDGKGKGITAPNPVGQRLAVRRAWQIASERPDIDTMMEGHGTSTRVGDVVEVDSLAHALSDFDLPVGRMPLGSVKSNIGHLKGAAGAAGILKAALAIHHRQIPPSLKLETPNPKIDFASIPFFVNTELRDWETRAGGIRRSGVSAFGFGGTNFHAVLEDHQPGRLTRPDRSHVSVSAPVESKPPLRGALVLGGNSLGDVRNQAKAVLQAAESGRVPKREAPTREALEAPVRLAADFADGAELIERLRFADKALATENPAALKALRARGVHVGRGPKPPIAFLYTGQGSQYVNMMRALKESEPVVAETVAEADAIMTPILGKPLSSYLYVDPNDEAAVQQANRELRQTAITQPAVLTVDMAMTRLMKQYGIEPDMVMGHSLGEYGALVAAGGMDFAHALEAVAARGREMTRVSVEDTGKMAAVMGPIEEVQKIVDTIDGYVVIANINSGRQAVIGGASAAVEQAVELCTERGMQAQLIPVSHAFHTSIVEPASGPLKEVLRRLDLRSVRIPLVGNVEGDFYPTGPDVGEAMVDMLGRQIASPVQFVKGLHRLYEAGARVFVEVGPKKALQGFAEDVLGSKEDVVALFTNHPKFGDEAAFNQALVGLYAQGAGEGRVPEVAARPDRAAPASAARAAASAPAAPARAAEPSPATPAPSASNGRSGNGQMALGGASAGARDAASGNGNLSEVGRLFARFMEDAFQAMGQGGGPDRTPVVVSGGSVGLPGGGHIFRDDNIARLLRGEQFIDTVPMRTRKEMVDRHITRLVKAQDGSGSFEIIGSPSEGIKLAGQPGRIGIVDDFGYPPDRASALDSTTALAMAAGVEALRDAGIPLVMHYKTTTRGTFLPERWMLPESMRDDTGVIFGAAFPGADAFAKEADAYRRHQELEARKLELENLRDRFGSSLSASVGTELDRRIADLDREIEENRYILDRRFVFRILAMGHSQFAEFIGARGPNTHVNAACASGTQALGIAEDWIRAGRCRRVIVLSADNVTSESLMPWIGSGFLASGAAATDELVEEAALPFDRRRHGLILGMGAAAMVVEREDSVRQRGMAPITEVMGTRFVNSAFHGTRLDPMHITQQVESLVAEAEAKFGVSRADMARSMVFVSHETYTPARGGSAQTEVRALRTVFGEAADSIVVANTKGMTGHAMGTGIEDILGVKALETGVVPAVPNFREIDPELGLLNLSKGGSYPVEYALRLGAGFGSQLALSLVRRVPRADGTRPSLSELGYSNRIDDPARWKAWLAEVSGHADAHVEVVHRTLRVADLGPSDVMVRRALEPRELATPAAVPPPAMTPPEPERPRVEARAPSAPPASRAPAPPPQPATPATPAVDPVETKILAIVAEQTGYPSDMLDRDLDLEADLGIDTVKQAEMFAAVREAFAIERDPNLQLRDFNTLNKVVGFVHDHRPDLAAPVPAPPAPSSAPAAAPAEPATDPVLERIYGIVTEQTGYPADMLDPELDLEADLGIDTVKQAEMFAAVRESFEIERDPNLQLRDFNTLTRVVGFVRDHRPDLAAAPSPVAPAPTPPSAAPAASSSGDDPVMARIFEIVTEQTGYPSDMLDPELDLEADLGIDTVKQAEMFAAVRESFGIERDPNLQLRDFNTLTRVVGFVRDHRPDLATSSPASASTAASPSPADTGPAEDEVLAKILEIVEGQTGYPSDMLDPELDLEADLGIDTVKQAEMFAAVRESFGIERDPNLQLRDFNTLTRVVGFVRDRRPDLAKTAAGPTSVDDGSGPSDDDPVRARIFEIVADQTGYPADMLDPELDLEADLGIDTVKQAEMFAAVRESFGIERDPNLQLRDFNTLNRVMGFVYDRKPELSQAEVASETKASSASTTAAAPTVLQGSLEAAAAIARRVPTPVLRPGLDRVKPTAVSLTAGSTVLVMPDRGGVGTALTARLEALGVSVKTLDPSAPASDAESFAGSGIDGVFWLPALDDEGFFVELSLEDFREGVRCRVKELFATMRALYGEIDRPERFLVTATRMGGRFGYDSDGATAPLGGAVSGFTKTYARERPEALVKVVDFAGDEGEDAVAAALLEEATRDPGPVEVGRSRGDRWTIALSEIPVEDGQAGLDFGEDSVFLVTGAAGSITSAIVADLASAAPGATFHLMDLAPAPDENDPDIRAFVEDRDGLKKDLFERIRASGEKATPVKVEKILAGLERKVAAVAALRAIRSRGGTAIYHSIDLRDHERVKTTVREIVEQYDGIDVILHAGGLEISRLLPDKSPDEFELVFDVKAQGWLSVMQGCEGRLPKASVAFSSIAGRFGNGGQSDYAAANDLLAKTSSALRARGVRAMVMDWTAWGGIGMATRGSIPKMMEMAGIDMLPPDAGIAYIRRELISGGRADEIVVAGALGILMEERDPHGGLDPDRVGSESPMIGRVCGAFVQDGWVVETEFDPKEQPFLDDHRIDGTAVLPGVMGIEAFAEIARLAYPERTVVRVEDVEFVAPFKFYRDEPRTVVVRARFGRDGDDIVGDCRFIGRRKLAGQSEPSETVHFTARVCLAEGPLEPMTREVPEVEEWLGKDAIYEVYFHGPAYRVLERAGRAGADAVGEYAGELPTHHAPESAPLALEPRWIEACFQTAGVQSIGKTGVMALPSGIRRVWWHGGPVDSGTIRAVTSPAEDGTVSADVVDTEGRVLVHLEGYRTADLPASLPDELAASFRRVFD